MMLLGNAHILGDAELIIMTEPGSQDGSSISLIDARYLRNPLAVLEDWLDGLLIADTVLIAAT